MRAKFLPWLLVLAGAVLVSIPWIAEASDPYLVVPAAEVVDQSPAYRYANMGEQQALDELDRRKILYQRTERHGVVRTPIRLTGRLHGVHIHSALPEHERPTTPFEICDARFALALDDFAAQLAVRGIVELVHYTMYRPSAESTAPAVSAAWAGSLSRLASQKYWLGASFENAKAPGTAKIAQTGKRSASKPAASGSRSASSPPRIMTGPSRHSLGLAIDLGAFVKHDGSVLRVGSHFLGKIGVQTCGPGSLPPNEPSSARELWDIVCDAFDAKVFTYVLTPNFDQPHHDHFHMEINPGVRWFLYH